MENYFSHSVEFYEDENEILIVVLQNKGKKDYKEVNLSFKALVMINGLTEEDYKTMTETGLLPKKDLYFHAWIHPALYRGLEENSGLEARMAISTN